MLLFSSLSGFRKMQMQVSQSKYTGLVADMMPNIRLMRLVGHFMHRFSSGSTFLSKVYSTIHLMLFLVQFVFLVINLALNTGEVNELTANTITVLHFTHTIIKFLYVAMNGKAVYRTFNIWNQPNSHPLFAESDARYHSIALAKMRKNFYFITTLTILTVIGESIRESNRDLGTNFYHYHFATAWTTITFFGESVKGVFDKETNETYHVEIPRLPVKSFYPWNAMSGIAYMGSFAFQVYYLLFSMLACNLSDVLFCSWLIFACEQLQHLKVFTYK